MIERTAGATFEILDPLFLTDIGINKHCLRQAVITITVPCYSSIVSVSVSGPLDVVLAELKRQMDLHLHHPPKI